MPALRLAQEEYGWLSPDALREVADALEVTPAYCQSVASFYDSSTSSRSVSTWSRCAPTSRARSSARSRCSRRSRLGLGCRAGETSPDGKVTLRTIECLGGCGWGTIVAVDHHYRTHVRADDVPAIVEGLTR